MRAFDDSCWITIIKKKKKKKQITYAGFHKNSNFDVFISVLNYLTDAGFLSVLISNYSAKCVNDRCFAFASGSGSGSEEEGTRDGICY